MIILDVEQGSEKWFNARIGLVSASNFGKIITPTGKKSTQYKTYMNTLIAEVMMGHKIDNHQSDAMLRGIELEPEARDYYEFQTDSEVKQVGLVYMDESKTISCSPDGLLKTKGLEIKCPIPHTQIEYLRSGKLPGKYIPQLQGSMLVTGLIEWDFLSYHPELQQLLITVESDTAYQAKMKVYLTDFVTEMKEAINQIKGIK